MKSKCGLVKIMKFSESPLAKCKCWALWARDSKRKRKLLGCYPSDAEAEQAQREEFSHLKRAFTIDMIDSAVLASLG